MFFFFFLMMIRKIISVQYKVFMAINTLETVNNGFRIFIKLFTQYGSDMVELAHLTGERQNDFKDEKRRAQLSSARWVLERSPIMILNAAKVNTI